jgi:hypothetical protein
MNRSRSLATFATVVVTAVILSAPADAAIITLDSIKDASIFKNNTDNSNGAGPGIFAGDNGMDSPRRGLIEFNIAGSIPAGSTITGVQLTLFLGQVAGTDSTPRTIGLFDLLADWGEGTTGAGGTIGGTGQGFPANPGDATWNARFFSGTLWGTPGGDHKATASATLSVNSVINAPFTWLSTPAFVGDVQGWLNNPATNFGWELINLDEVTTTDFRAFYTREESDPTLRPQLQVTFTAPVAAPEPANMVSFPLGMIGLVVGAIAAQRLSRPL